jgi:dienelactone hydrolase
MTAADDKPKFTHQDLLWYPDPQGGKHPLTSAAQWPLRRAAILAAMQDVMGPLPDRSALPPFDLRVHGTLAGDGYTRQTISFANVQDERITAYLYVPSDLKPRERRPAALALQPTGIEGKDIPDGTGPKGTTRGYAAELARHGYVVIAPDYPSFGEQKDYDFTSSKYASGTMKAVSDNLRCIDLLQSRPDVDPDKLACIGHSLGGHNALFTAAFDTRIHVAVTSCGWTPFHHYYGGKQLINWAQDRYMPRVRDVYHADPARMPFDFQEVIAAIAPRAVFSNSPTRDSNFDVDGVRLASAEITRLYTLLGAADHFVVRYPDYAHDFDDASRRDAYQFIDVHLGHVPARAAHPEGS